MVSGGAARRLADRRLGRLVAAELGHSANDTGDGDTGPNNLQNFPVLTSTGVGVNTTVHGTLNSRPNILYLVEIFSNTSCDPGFFGEGETSLGTITVTTNATGNFAVVGTFPPVPAGRFITATATDQTTGDTSEFAACRTALQAGISVGPLSLQTTEANEGVGFDAELTVRATTVPVANVVIPMSIQDSTEGAIVSQTPLTITPAMGTASQTVRINGVDDGIDDGNLAYAALIRGFSLVAFTQRVKLTRYDSRIRAPLCSGRSPAPTRTTTASIRPPSWSSTTTSCCNVPRARR